MSKKTLAISGLTVAVITLGLAAITLGYMVGAVSLTVWVVAAASLPACMSNPTLPLQSSSELKSELVAKIDSLDAKFAAFNDAYMYQRSLSRWTTSSDSNLNEDRNLRTTGPSLVRDG